jgi:NitT/TauT family transport system ATP-binding protein
MLLEAIALGKEGCSLQVRDRRDGAVTGSAAPTRPGPARAVEARGLRKTYPKGNSETEIFRDLDLHVDEGEFLGVIGLSGCGKSTLLKVISGLTPYQDGSLSVLGRSVEDPRSDVGFVFQHLALLPWRTVLDNVLLPAELERRPKVEAEQEARACLEQVGLNGFEDYYLREISGGMQQRVALSRSLMTKSKLLLLDEPFGALDELTRESVGMLFLDVCQQTGAATILVTHSVQEAALMSDRIFVMPPRSGMRSHWITVDLPRPRTADMVGSPEFNRAVLEVRAALGLAV